MKKLLFATTLILAFCIIGFGQEPKTRAEPVPGLNPVLMTGADFEKLDVPASMDRFGKISDKEKTTRLDRFVSIISAGNQTIEFVVLLNGAKPADVGSNMAFVYRHLVTNKKITPSRISFAVSEESVEETELWLVPNTKVLVPSCPACMIIPAEDREKLNTFFQEKKAH